MQDLIGYDSIIENAMRSVIYETLKKVEKFGLLGKHYFVITFLTRFPGVVLSKELAEKYYEEMTVVIQRQYKNLTAMSDGFKVSLSFFGKFEKLVIPYKAITAFADPSMSFALKFSINNADFEAMESEDYGEKNLANKDSLKVEDEEPLDLSAKVISLDAFRRNRNKNNPNNP